MLEMSPAVPLARTQAGACHLAHGACRFGDRYFAIGEWRRIGPIGPVSTAEVHASLAGAMHVNGEHERVVGRAAINLKQVSLRNAFLQNELDRSQGPFAAAQKDQSPSQ